MEHTKGPWEIDHGLRIIARNVERGPMPVADVRGWGYLTGKGHGALGLPFDEAEKIQTANARLLVAAPDMAHEGKFLLDRLDDFEREIQSDELAREWAGHVSPSIERLRAIIAKALCADGQTQDLK
jgi:hypothetical protein